VLFICTENICRSPLAEGLLRHHLKLAGLGRRVSVSSAGTIASQPGARPDPRAVRLASEAGVKLGSIRARRVTEKDLMSSDFIVAMDRSHLRELQQICPREHLHKLSLLLSHDPTQVLDDVPDPYYGSYEGFVEVFGLIERAINSLVPRIG
jgi:protein-tyrosine phosphatase